MIDDLICYVVRSDWVYQSVEAVRPKLYRWARRLEERGVTTVPLLTNRDQMSRADYSRSCNEINLLMCEHSGDQATAHHLRNLTRVRPFKP